MANLKLFGSSRSAAHVAQRGEKKGASGVETKEKKQKKPLKTIAIILTVILCLEGLYFFCIYSNNAFIKKYRTIYITTAMNTMTHQWLATYFIPGDVIDTVMYDYGMAIGEAIGKESSWGKADTSADPTPAAPSTSDSEKTSDSAEPGVKPIEPDVSVIEPDVTVIESETPSAEEIEKQERDAFYELFWELDQASFDAYLDKNPDVLSGGWNKIHINEAGFEENGIDAKTLYDEQVLGLDAENGILLVRVSSPG
ncbi:MAG: hypothetical protein MJ118_03935 [Clostridia bacterium]|nr:hypothetical protein [Clostridia bacterium]